MTNAYGRKDLTGRNSHYQISGIGSQTLTLEIGPSFTNAQCLTANWQTSPVYSDTSFLTSTGWTHTIRHMHRIPILGIDAIDAIQRDFQVLKDV